MRVCVVGGGGREHALAAALARTADVVVTPGNPGIPWSLTNASDGTGASVGSGAAAPPPEEVDADLYVIGPEQPLVDGLADRLRARGKVVFGPGADGAQIEGSKAWMKALLVDAGVPTAAHGVFGAGDVDAALAFLRSLPAPYVVKTDGLAAGKGVLVTASLAEAEADVRAKLAGSAFGAAGSTVVIEEAMAGPEVSLLCLCDGTRVVALPSAQDFKRVDDGDQGPNTGGMGAWSPLPFVPPSLVDDVLARCVEPTVAALRRRGIDYRGVLYAGLMLTADGPKVLEYNARFGDPETQAVLPRITDDLAAHLHAAAAGRLLGTPAVSADAAVTVVCAAPGYPAAPRTGDVIEGIDAARATGAQLFFAGVGRDGAGRLVTAGGRVLAATGTGPTVAAARAQAYAAVDRLSWPGRHARRDIAAAG